MEACPIVTVALFTYNRPTLLTRAIECVLNQTYDNFELYIYDDASTDHTPKVVKQYASIDDRIVYVRRSKNLGIIKSVVAATKRINGQYFCTIADDDFLLPNCLADHVEAFKKYPEAGISAASLFVNRSEELSFHGHVDAYFKPIESTVEMIKANSFVGSMMFRSKILEQVSGFSTEVGHIFDRDFAYRAGLLNGVVFSAKPVMCHCQSDNCNTIRILEHSKAESYDCMQKMFDNIQKFSSRFPDIRLYQVNHAMRKWLKDLLKNELLLASESKNFRQLNAYFNVLNASYLGKVNYLFYKFILNAPFLKKTRLHNIVIQIFFKIIKIKTFPARKRKQLLRIFNKKNKQKVLIEPSKHEVDYVLSML